MTMGRLIAVAALLCAVGAWAQDKPQIEIHYAGSADAFALVTAAVAAPVMVEPGGPEVLRRAADAFCGDVESVTGRRPRRVEAADAAKEIVMVGVVGSSPLLDEMRRTHKLDTSAIEGKWEAAIVTVVSDPVPGVKRALVVAGSDRRGAAFALLGLSRAMGVSPWVWWADVPVTHHSEVWVTAANAVQPSPSVQYRGIFFNDEDWGFRPWAAKTLDADIHNIGPHTYAKVFELLLRLRANTLWPAMHPGSLAFNATPENARLADAWGIVMGASHSEALLRNNVGEWDERRDGPWNFQTNRASIEAYWKKRLEENGAYENFYTVGMRGVHDGVMEATGTREQKAQLVEQIMAVQQKMLTDITHKEQPQVIWLYKEVLDLYRAGMRVPEDVTLGFSDDNYGYLRELPTVEEQQRKGGAGVYYHVSYWGAPHDYLWLCTTPPALIREEMTKAYDHGARKYWVLNVGDLKPAEMDVDYFMQLAWDEPGMSGVEQKDFLGGWFAEQFGAAQGSAMAATMNGYYALNFIRKPEFMGFNGYNDGVKRTLFNPLAWGDQNRERDQAWQELVKQERATGAQLPPLQRAAFYELEGYPVEASAAQNTKFLAADRTYLDIAAHLDSAKDAAESEAAYHLIQTRTAQYNSLMGGKWSGMMSADPRERHVFEMPTLATSADMNTPGAWARGAFECNSGGVPGFFECDKTVSINAAHFTAKSESGVSQWRVVKDLGVSGDSMVFGRPGLLAESDAPVKEAWLEYAFTTSTDGEASLAVEVLPTFAVDRKHTLRFGVSLDGRSLGMVQPPAKAAGGGGAAGASWAEGVLSNEAEVRVALGKLAPGTHRIRLQYVDPGVVFEHLLVTFAGAPPGYPVPPEMPAIVMAPRHLEP